MTDDAPRRAQATLRTRHDDPDVVAAALAPDNTAEMETRVEGARVVTTVERETASGLRATVDDYVVNLTVADQLAADRTDDSTADRPADNHQS